MINKKGVTLLELILVVIIISVVSVIVVPIIFDNSNEARDTAHDVNVDTLQAQGELYSIQNRVSRSTNILDDMITNGYIKKVPKNPYIEMKSFENKEYIVSVDSDGSVMTNLAAGDNGVHNKPDLLEGMTPVYWDIDQWRPTAEENIGNEWYKYNGDIDNEADANKDDGVIANIGDEKWANVELADGSMFVWIPRYTYKILGKDTPADSSDDRIRIRYTKGFADDLSNDYIAHPAFRLGGKELTGIWVAKFEASSVEGYESGDGSGGYDADNVTTKTVQIKPNKSSWRGINVSNAFTVSREMRNNPIYGWTPKDGLVDTHLSRNVDWGAVAYLTEAIRDGEEVWINNYLKLSDYALQTGSSAKVKNDNNKETVDIYPSPGSERASTTGEIHGIYDFNGGAFEYQSAYIDNNHSNLKNYALDLLKEKNRKYVEVYAADSTDNIANWNNSQTNAENVSTANFNSWSTKNGDALYEVAYGVAGNTITPWTWYGSVAQGWHSDYSDYTLGGWADAQFFIRGGSAGYTTVAGIFSFGPGRGVEGNDISFRPIITNGAGK